MWTTTNSKNQYLMTNINVVSMRAMKQSRALGEGATKGIRRRRGRRRAQDDEDEDDDEDYDHVKYSHIVYELVINGSARIGTALDCAHNVKTQQEANQ